MTKEEKQLLLKDLSTRLPYGLKILYTDWDCDSGTDFDTVETLIGIDDRFIYTIWDKTGDREKHCLSVSNWKPYLRPMSSMTEDEEKEYNSFIIGQQPFDSDFSAYPIEYKILYEFDVKNYIDWLNAHHFDYQGLIKKSLAIAVTEDNNPYKE